MMTSEKGQESTEDPLLTRDGMFSTSSDFHTEPFRSSTSLEEEERMRRRVRSVHPALHCSSFLYLVLVGIVITFVLFVLLLLDDPWQLMAILIILALLMLCAYRLRR